MLYFPLKFLKIAEFQLYGAYSAINFVKIG